MKVEALVAAAGPPGQFSFRPGDVMDLPDGEAEMLLNAKAVRALEPQNPRGRKAKTEPQVAQDVVAGKAPEEDGTPTVKPAV